jgi:hypothetical protein
VVELLGPHAAAAAVRRCPQVLAVGPFRCAWPQNGSLVWAPAGSTDAARSLLCVSAACHVLLTPSAPHHTT